MESLRVRSTSTRRIHLETRGLHAWLWAVTIWTWSQWARCARSGGATPHQDLWSLSTAQLQDGARGLGVRVPLLACTRLPPPLSKPTCEDFLVRLAIAIRAPYVLAFFICSRKRLSDVTTRRGLTCATRLSGVSVRAFCASLLSSTPEVRPHNLESE